MQKNKIGPKNRSVNLVHPKCEPLSRVWFLARGYKQADTRYTAGQIVWLHPRTNDVLSEYGTKLALQVKPKEKHRKNTTRYLRLTCQYGSMFLARLKYLTFTGDIPEGFVIDHIDGDTFNNNIDNLRAVQDAINRRDGGFLRKLRNHRIDVRMYPGIILEGYERMAKFKATHKKWQYDKLTRKDLLLLFIGDGFRIAEPSEIEFDEPFKYADMYER